MSDIFCENFTTQTKLEKIPPRIDIVSFNSTFKFAMLSFNFLIHLLLSKLNTVKFLSQLNL